MDSKVTFCVMPGKQGDRDFYVTSLPYGQLAAIVQIADSAMPIELRNQRQIDPRRVKKIVDYLEEKRSRFVFPSIFLNLDPKAEVSIEPVSSGAIEMSLPLGKTRLFVVDGQHRLTALAEWYEQTGDSSILEESLSVMIFRLDEKGLREAFVDINSTAKPVDKSATSFLGSPSGGADLARAIIGRGPKGMEGEYTIPVLRAIVDPDKRVTATSKVPKLFGFEAIEEVVSKSFGTKTPFVQRKKAVWRFWKGVAENVPEWGEVAELRGITARQAAIRIRQEGIAGTLLFIRALSRVCENHPGKDAFSDTDFSGLRSLPLMRGDEAIASSPPTPDVFGRIHGQSLN
jgi:DGQHR domain-containing protein